MSKEQKNTVDFHSLRLKGKRTVKVGLGIDKEKGEFIVFQLTAPILPTDIVNVTIVRRGTTIRKKNTIVMTQFLSLDTAKALHGLLGAVLNKGEGE